MSGDRRGRTSTPPARLAELRAAASGLAERGWPVRRGTYLSGGIWRGRADAVGLRPVDDDWGAASVPGSAEIARWWADAPYSVLVVCGRGVDCVELPWLTQARRLLAALRAHGLFPPVMATPMGRLALFVRTPPTDRCRFQVSASVHLAGAWVPVPPTDQRHGHAGRPARDLWAGEVSYRWLTGWSPAQLNRRPGWMLPELAEVGGLITASVISALSAELAPGIESDAEPSPK